MTDKRIIFMSRDNTINRWFVSRENNIVERGNADNVSELEQWHDLETDVVLLGTDVIIKTVEIPGSNARTRLKAAPFAMEEHLASDIEAMHFAYQIIKDTQAIKVIAIEHKALQDYLAQLASLSITPTRIIPIAALLDTPNGCLSVMQIEEHVLINNGIDQWLTDADSAQIQLTLLEREEEQPLLYWSAEEPPAWLLGKSFATQSELLLDPWQSLIARLETCPLNLLSGQYAQKSDLLQISSGWRRTLQFAATLLVLHLIYMAVELTYLSNAREGLKEEVTALYQEVAPGARVVDARRQMQQLVQQRQGATLSNRSFALMVQSLTEAMQRSAGLEPTNLNYSAQNAELRVDLLAGNLSQFDSLKQSLEAIGYEVTMGGASAQGEQYSGRIVMRSMQ